MFSVLVISYITIRKRSQLYQMMLVRSTFQWWRSGWLECPSRIFGNTLTVFMNTSHTSVQSVPPTTYRELRHVSRKSARLKHWDVCCNKIPTSSFTIWRMLLHSHSTTFRSCQVSCLRGSWPHASSHSVHELLATNLCVVGLVPASHIDFHHCLAAAPACWRSSQVCRRSLATLILGHLFRPSHSFCTVTPVFLVFDTYPSPCLHPWLSCARWHNRTHQKRQCVLSRTQLVKTNRYRRGPWTKPRTPLRTSEIKPRSWRVGNHCPSRRTPPNWVTGYSRLGGVSLLNSSGSLEADSSPVFGPTAELGPTCFCPSLRATSLPVRTSMVMTVQFSALVQSQLCLRNSSAFSERNSFPTYPGLLSAVGRRMYSSRRLRGGNAHVTRPAQYVAILLVTTAHLPCDKLYFSDTDLRLDCNWVSISSEFHVNPRPTNRARMSGRLACPFVRIQLVKTNSAPLASGSQTFSFNVCRNTTSLILASLTCSGSSSAPVNSWKNL